MDSGNRQMINSLVERGDTNKARVKSDQDGLSGAKVLGAIADDKAWILFRTIATSIDSNRQQTGDGSQILISNLNLTRKQYYQRINRLTSLGLIYRKGGRYNLSSFGKILYEIQNTIETAIQNRWKFVAIDSLESSLSAEEMPTENKIKIINALLGDHDEIKNMLLCKNNGSSGHITKAPQL
jgi:hypothetical protein